MFQHIVLMRFSPNADARFFARVQDYARRVRSECEGVMSYSFTQNASDRSDGLTHAVIGHFRSSRDHDAYQVSDVHVAMKAEMAPYIDRIVVFDGETADA